MTSKLTVTPTQPGFQRVSISGRVSMTRAEAEQLIANGHSVELRLWGAEPAYADLLLGPYTATSSATSAGLEFRKELLVIGHRQLDQGSLRVGAQVVDRGPSAT
jgi:hypothetical protein